MRDWVEWRCHSKSQSPLQPKEKIKGYGYERVGVSDKDTMNGFVGFGEAAAPSMATKVKGFFKGIKSISQIFVVKEHEMEIGYPTDVRHVAHIGWDSSSMNSPSWMSEFKTSSHFSSTSLNNFGQSREESWISQDYDQRRVQEPGTTGMFADPLAGAEISKTAKKKKVKQKKTKVSSPSVSSKLSRFRSSSRSSYATTVEEAGELQNQITLAA